MRTFRILWVVGLIFVLDQATKWLIRQNMHLHESISVMGNFFRLTYVENRGMAFGIQVSNQVFFTVFAVIASIVIIVYLFRFRVDQLWPRWAMTFILGGALGNLFDRIFRGQVVDFIDFEFFDIHIPAFQVLGLHFPGYDLERWPIFNVADITVTIGMMMLLIYVIFMEQSNLQESKKISDSEIIG